jgi:hypothetical protein
MLEPARGACTEATCEFTFSNCSTRPTVCVNAASVLVSCDEWTTTISAELERPPKFVWISFRA